VSGRQISRKWKSRTAGRFRSKKTLAKIEAVTIDGIQEIAREFFRTEQIALAALGNLNGLKIRRERLDVS
jgi:predicted Zn-dependent peptidase